MDMQKLLICRGVAFVSLVCAPLAGIAFAQGNAPPPAQALAELRADVQGRADHQAYPIAGIDRGDVREVLASLKSIDREEWAAAWSSHGRAPCRERPGRGDHAAAREQWRQAWLDYHFGAWPAQNTPASAPIT